MSLKQRWQDARIRRHRKRIESLIDDQQWSPALTAVIDFAQWAEGSIDDADVWLDMTISATRIVGHLEDPAEYRAFLTHFASPFLGEDDRPRTELLDAFASISDHVEPTVMTSIGRWLSDARPGWPLGPYLIGHFSEVDDTLETAGERAAKAVTHFDVAARRAERLDDRRWQRHAELRHGTLLLTSGADRQTGRAILGELDWSKLTSTEQLWMAVALASSPRWTDRVRSMDIVLDLHEAVDAARPTHRNLRFRDLRRAASTIFKLAGLDLPEAEQRRLEQLSDTLFEGSQKRQWEDFLASRKRLSTVATLDLDDVADAEPLLHELAEVYPERWKPATRRFRILRAGYTGNYQASQDVPSSGRRDSRLPIADAVARVLNILVVDRSGDDVDQISHDDLSQALQKLVDILEKLDTDGDGAAARPVALIWSHLLSVASRLDIDELRPTLSKLARRHTMLAPPPSYGWWTLAAHLYDGGADDAAYVIANTALSGDEYGAKDDLRGFVASRAFRRAVDNCDAGQARQWLDELPS